MNRIKQKVKAVIFDMDGTIIRTEHLWLKATKGVLTRRGFRVFTPEQVKHLGSLSGIGLLESAQVMKDSFNLKDSIHQIAAETKQIAHSLFAHKLEFIDGFELFHERLTQSSIPTSVATNADKASLQLLDQKMNLNKFFGRNLYSVEHVGNKAKPDPALFLHAAQQLNVQPDECIVFEDSIFGFRAAIAAGMKCIAIKNNGNRSYIDKAHGAIDSYHEAEEALVKVITSNKKSSS